MDSFLGGGLLRSFWPLSKTPPARGYARPPDPAALPRKAGEDPLLPSGPETAAQAGSRRRRSAVKPTVSPAPTDLCFRHSRQLPRALGLPSNLARSQPQLRVSREAGGSGRNNCCRCRRSFGFCNSAPAWRGRGGEEGRTQRCVVENVIFALLKSFFLCYGKGQGLWAGIW